MCVCVCVKFQWPSVCVRPIKFTSGFIADDFVVRFWVCRVCKKHASPRSLSLVGAALGLSEVKCSGVT